MDGAIIYSSRYGTTKSCAQYLKESIKGNIDIIDVDKLDLKTIDIEKYNTIILGSSIYIGSVSKNMKAFCSKNTESLKEKTVGIFICCGQPNKAKEFMAANFPSEILGNCGVTGSFGGEAKIDKMKFVDKCITKIVTKGKFDNWIINKEELDKFARQINDK